MKWAVAVMLLVACPGKPPPGNGSGSGSNGGGPVTCDSMRGKLEQLYRAEGTTREPKRVDEYVSDNTTMVLAECAKAPDRAGCIDAATTIAEIESKCVTKLDDEGSEGLELRK